MGPYSTSDATDSEDIDLEVASDKTGLNTFVAKSGIGESGQRSTEFRDSGDSGLTSYSNDGKGSTSLFISEPTDIGEGDQLSAIEAIC